MTQFRSPTIRERIYDFYDTHFVVSIAAMSVAGSLAVIAALAGMNAVLQPKEWQDAITSAVQDDGFSEARHSFFPDLTSRTIAKTTLMYQGCALEGVTLTIGQESQHGVDVTAYDLSTAERAIEYGVLPQTIHSISDASELAGKISLPKCIG